MIRFLPMIDFLTYITANCSRIGLRSLCIDWQFSQVPDPAVALHIFKTFDVTSYLAFQIPFNFIGLDDLSNLIFFNWRNFFWSLSKFNLGLGQYLLRTRSANAENSGQRYFHSFIFRQCYS